MSEPFTPEQEARIAEIIRQELATQQKQITDRVITRLNQMIQSRRTADTSTRRADDTTPRPSSDHQTQ